MDNLRKGANNIRMLPFAFWILYGVAAITRPYDYTASICYVMDVCGLRTVEVQESLPRPSLQIMTEETYVTK